MGLTIIQAVWLIAVHSVLHGVYGVFLVTTSFYVNYNAEILHTIVAMNIILIVLGFSLFCVVVWRRPTCCKVFAILFVLLTIAFLIVGIMYFVRYFPFFANSIFDSFFFYTDIECWVGPDYVMTIWHVLTAILVFLLPLWFFYAFLLWKLAYCVCTIPCPSPPCVKRMERCIDENPCGPPVCCQKLKWYQKILRPARCGPAPPPNPCCPPPQCPPPCPTPCPQPCPPPCVPCPPPCPNPCPPPCSPCPRKTPKFVLTLKPGRMVCK